MKALFIGGIHDGMEYKVPEEVRAHASLLVVGDRGRPCLVGGADNYHSEGEWQVVNYRKVYMTVGMGSKNIGPEVFFDCYAAEGLTNSIVQERFIKALRASTTVVQKAMQDMMTSLETRLDHLRGVLLDYRICPTCGTVGEHHKEEPFSDCTCGTGEDNEGPGPLQQYLEGVGGSVESLNQAIKEYRESKD